MSLGSKIENLKTLKNAGLPVPEFEAYPYRAAMRASSAFKDHSDLFRFP